VRATRAAGSLKLDERIVRAGFVVALGAVVIQTIAYVLNVAVFDARVTTLLVDVDTGVFTWASSSASFTAGFLAFALAVAGRSFSARYAVLAAILTVFSIDDAVAIHERFAAEAAFALDRPEATYGRLLWIAAYAPLLATAAVILWRTSYRAPRMSRLALRLGLVLLGAGIFFEGVVSTTIFAAGGSQGGWPDVVAVTIEEGAELGGWILIAAGLTGIVVSLLGTRSAALEPTS